MHRSLTPCLFLQAPKEPKCMITTRSSSPKPFSSKSTLNTITQLPKPTQVLQNQGNSYPGLNKLSSTTTIISSILEISGSGRLFRTTYHGTPKDSSSDRDSFSSDNLTSPVSRRRI